MDYQKYYSQYEAFLNTIPQLEQVEQKTGQEKGKVVAAVLAVIVLILFAMDVLDTLICDWVGFFWPAYMSFVALEQGGDVDQWLKYWVIFGLFTLFVDNVGIFLPMYDYIKMFIFMWCMIPKSDGPQS